VKRRKIQNHITRKKEGTWIKYTVVNKRGRVLLVTDSRKRAKQKFNKLKEFPTRVGINRPHAGQGEGR
jgi:hypothetical protein